LIDKCCKYRIFGQSDAGKNSKSKAKYCSKNMSRVIDIITAFSVQPTGNKKINYGEKKTCYVNRNEK